MSQIIIGGASNGSNLVQEILAAMQSVINKHGLDLLQRYPDDLLVHDKGTLGEYAVPGAKIAWMVGHNHTHIVPLGLRQEENRKVTYLTNLANDDRFYILKVHADRFTMEELDRMKFEALQFTPVMYARVGDKSGFWLTNRRVRVGYISLESIGTLHSPKVSATITPVADINGLDRSALEMWTQHAIIKVAGTLFVQQVVNWAEPVRLVQVA